MTELRDRLAGLSPEKRRLLELRLRQQRAHAAGPVLAPRPRDGAPLPLAFSQQRLWVLDQLEPGTAAFNLLRPLRLRGMLDVAALERALDALRARHESLRTTFAAGADGSPVQVIHPFAPTPLAVEDLSPLADEEREAAVQARAHGDAHAGFDLAAGPLFRARLLRLGEDEHVLLLALHHVVADGWSLGILARELGALYAAFRAGAPDPLPPLPVQYADYALWQREHLTGETLEKQRAFWRQALAGAPAALELPTDRPRPPAESHRGRVWRDRMEPELARRVRALAQQEETTTFAVLLAGLRAVLARWSGQEELVIGAPVAGRGRSEVEGLIGFFVNTLPLSGTVRTGDSFRALLRRERDASLAALDHQDLPFERIVEELRIPRDLSRGPVFQVSLMLQNTPAEAERLPGLEVAPLQVEFETARLDLAFDLYEEADGGLRIETEYATDLFEHATVGRMVAHLKRLLWHAAADPDASVARLELLDAEERAAVVQRPDATARDWPFTPVHRLFAEQAARTPEAVAVEGADGALTYAELDALSAGVAAALRARGVGRGSLVAVCAERSARMVAALLGVLRAGAAYLPLDPGYPAERLAYMLEDSGARLLLADRALADRLPSSATGRIFLDGIGPADAAGRDEVDVGGEDLAYVIYTSGSTGRPKGVMVRHGGVSSFLRSMAETPGVRPDDALLAVTTIAFDISVLELFLPLSIGARTVVATRELAADPTLLAALLARSGATVIQATPATWAMLLASGWTPPAGLRVFSGGEALPRTVADALLAAGAEVWNLYGPTETTIWSAAARVPAQGAIPLGEPAANTTLYVLDPVGNPAPLGVPGELCIGGTGVARGYLHRPALTAERFVPDPFGAPGSRLYRTGDRVRRRVDGALEFLGRVDFQVKLRGFRIEPGEIESALRGHPAVRDAVVLVRGEGADARLIAYVVASAPDAPPAGTELRAFVRERLPEHMVPSAFVALDAFPLTPAGKLDRNALPDPAAPPADADGEAPRGPVEEVLAGIWAELLGGGPVHRGDSFFERGGHSLAATRLMSRISRVLGVDLPLKAIFAAPTLAALAGEIESARAAADGVERIPPIRPLGDTDAPPLSFAQERMWFLDRLAAGTGAYNVPVVVELAGPLQVDALRDALEVLVTRHDALRTRIVERDGEPVAVISPPEPFALLVTDVAEEELDTRLEEETRRSFDLSRDLPIRGALFRTAADTHLLALTFHHAAVDGWSLGILLRELSTLYVARVREHDAALPPPAVRYADYAAWQRAWLQGSALAAQTAYWREALAGAPGAIDLPADRPRPARQSFRGGLHAFLLPARVAERVRALSAAEHGTPFMATLAAFVALLGRYANAADVVVGAPVAGRHRPETEPVVGLFANTLALRTGLSGDPTFRELVRRVRDVTLDAYAHQDLPFERLVDELRVERRLDRAPVFQVMFSFDAPDAAGLELSDVVVRERVAPHRTAKFDLTLNLEEAEGELRAYLEYAADLFDAVTAERIGDHYVQLLDHVLADPDRRLSSVDPVTDAERVAVVAWNAAAAHPAHLELSPVHVQVAEQAARTPDAIAVDSGAGRLTYAELDARANALAHRLIAAGVRVESRVTLVLERSPEMVVALLAVLRAGAAYVPVDPGYPAQRIAWLLQDSGAAVVLTQAHLTGSLPATDAQVIVISADETERSEAVAGELPVVHPQSIAYVIYTSGSTGTPKGVEVPHRALANHMAWMRRRFPLGADGAVLQKTPFGFDASVWEFWAPLLEGARLVMARPAGHRDPAYLVDALRGERITAVQLVPPLLAVLVDEPGLEACTSLRRVYVGGEALPAELVRRLRARLDVEVVNLYGPTETCIEVSFQVADPDAALPSVPIGRPVDNARLYVLDDQFRMGPAGAVGELCVGGAGVARGYLGRPALTAERFVPDPFGAPGSRLYRTGDRARLGTDGALHYLGRADLQVKVRGYRVEPGEIETALLRDPAVREAAAVARDGAVAAFVVPAEGRTIDPARLRGALQEMLPEHMVPSAIVPIGALPLTPNGKVDRAALAATAPVEPAAHSAVPPETDTERALAATWETLLPGRAPGREDGFFDLGGHSLSAMRLLARIRQSLGVDLPIRTVFEAPRLREMAARIDAIRRSAGERAPEIVPVGRSEPLPLSFAQERMWFIDRMLPGSAVYAMPFRLRLEGEVDAEALRRALEELVHRHESLRTVFPSRDGRPLQVVLPPAPFALPVRDLSVLPLDAARAGAERLADEDARRPFDLAAGPLVRAALARVAPEEWLLLLNLHHIVADGWSVDILFRELAQGYAAHAEGRAPNLPPLAAQYVDYAVWQRSWLTGEQLERQVQWWRDRLAGAPVLELPTDRPRPATPSFRGASVEFRVDAGTARAADDLARTEGATRFQLLLAVFAVLLSRWSGEEDVVVGSPVAGRGRPETEGMVGLFVNTLALRADLSGDPAFRAVVGRVRQSVLGAFAHQEVPFERLVDALKVDRSLSRHPLFQVSFSVQEPADAPALGTVRMTVEPAENGTAKFDLIVALEPDGDGLAGGIYYAADLFDAATARRMAEHFTSLLGSLVADPDRPLSRLPGLLRGEERRRVLEEWSGADHPYPRRPIHELIAEQAARAPDASAVVRGARTLAYRELDESANRLAHHLVARGAAAESIVGIVAERAPETVTAMLAVLKAGAACLPLDPANPPDRLRYMLRDSGARLVISAGPLPSGLEGIDAEVVDVRAEAASIGTRPATDPRVPCDAANLAYVIYTSGSTGRPKAVAVSHGGVPNVAHMQRTRLGMRPGDRVLQFNAFSFDVSAMEVFGTLQLGATLVMAPREALMAGEPLLSTLRRERITVAQLPPALLAILSPYDLPELRVVVAGGEALSGEAVERWAGAVELHNGYGPTECTVVATSARVKADGRAPSIGRPLDNLRCHVVDRAGQPAPVGLPGELWIGGAGVARGYLHRPALTAERFVPDPFGAPGSRLYRTGDRVRWLADGTLEFLGRLDAQVKVRGYRIEPGEISSRLAELPGVRDALVRVRPDARGDARLVAWVAAPDHKPSAAELREQLRRVLPDYMVPQAYVVMDAFPRTPNGKVDHAALPAQAEPAGAPAVTPHGELEQAIAAVWRTVLGLQAVGVNDSFFEVGGHSLLLARLQDGLMTALRREVSIIDLFQYPTIASFAAHLDARVRAIEASDAQTQPPGRGRGASRRELLTRGRR